MHAVASADKQAERAALARFEVAVGEILGDPTRERGGFLDEIERRWSDTHEPERTQGIARDIVLLHIATMTNLFAALGWTLAQLALHPDVLARVVRRATRALLERCALESTRIGQCSVMSRTVLNEIEIDDGTTRYRLAPGVTARDDAGAHQHQRGPRARPLRPRPVERPAPPRRRRAPRHASR